MIKLDLQHFAEDELLGTWVFNDKLTLDVDTITFNLDFTYLDGETKEIYNCTSIKLYYGNEDIFMEFICSPVDDFVPELYPYGGKFGFYYGKDYKTITITDTSKLTNRDEFVKWFSANSNFKPKPKDTKTDVILTQSSDKPNDEIYPVTRTDLLRNKEYATPFIAKTDEDKQIAKDENGNLWYKGGDKVTANPVLSGGEPELTGLQVGENKYKMPSGGSGGASWELVTDVNILHNKLNTDDKYLVQISVTKNGYNYVALLGLMNREVNINKYYAGTIYNFQTTSFELFSIGYQTLNNMIFIRDLEYNPNNNTFKYTEIAKFEKLTSSNFNYAYIQKIE